MYITPIVTIAVHVPACILSIATGSLLIHRSIALYVPISHVKEPEAHAEGQKVEEPTTMNGRSGVMYSAGKENNIAIKLRA